MIISGPTAADIIRTHFPGEVWSGSMCCRINPDSLLLCAYEPSVEMVLELRWAGRRFRVRRNAAYPYDAMDRRSALRAFGANVQREIDLVFGELLFGRLEAAS